MDPLLLGALVGASTILILFSGISVGIGLLVVSGLFILMFENVCLDKGIIFLFILI